MHGQKKIKKEEIDEAKKIVTLQKIKKYEILFNATMELKQRKDLSDEALKQVTTLLMYNPELYSIWNYRRLIIQDRIGKIDSDLTQEDNDEERLKILEEEFSVTEGVIAAHPKSYWCWFQRKWIVQQIPEKNRQSRVDLDIQLCDKMLNADSRNFHCWNYRRFIVTQGKVAAKSEFEFTTNKIEQNFSNYSAWHQRSSLFPVVHPEMLQIDIDQEFEFVSQALFTEPADQSAWFYHRWLRSLSLGSTEVLQRELGNCESLLELEPESKWAILTKIFILKELGTTEEVGELLEKLKVVDPMRIEFYKDFGAIKL
eukprot:TRINITY_DN4772_c0_g1_i1.p1 TRINITY_DN4772_c0_g1~~TRINITY_DN4772_c0_g1_i1.p1  ORF type:complete len:313 (-),score=105.84 TRINITY_DN4772_c0_g1_i1:43-981(-)